MLLLNHWQLFQNKIIVLFISQNKNIFNGNQLRQSTKRFLYQRMMVPFIRPEIFPSQLLPLLARHFKNPTASSDVDATLSLALKQFDQQNDKNYIFELPYGSHFRIHNGKILKKGALRTKRYECVEISTGRMYLFNPNAEVELLPS